MFEVRRECEAKSINRETAQEGKQMTETILSASMKKKARIEVSCGTIKSSAEVQVSHQRIYIGQIILSE